MLATLAKPAPSPRRFPARGEDRSRERLAPETCSWIKSGMAPRRYRDVPVWPPSPGPITGPGLYGGTSLSRLPPKRRRLQLSFLVWVSPMGAEWIIVPSWLCVRAGCEFGVAHVDAHEVDGALEGFSDAAVAAREGLLGDRFLICGEREERPSRPQTARRRSRRRSREWRTAFDASIQTDSPISATSRPVRPP